MVTCCVLNDQIINTRFNGEIVKLPSVYKEYPHLVIPRLGNGRDGDGKGDESGREGKGDGNGRDGEDIIKMVDWHPFKQILALGHCDNVVIIHHLSKTILLENTKMIDLTCLKWHPLMNCIAIGTRNLVFIYKLLNDQPWAETIQFECSCLTWSPCGRFLVIGSWKSSEIIIYDVILQQQTSLKRFGNATRELVWMGDYLVQVKDLGLTIWNVFDWSCQHLASKKQCHVLDINIRVFVRWMIDYFGIVKRENQKYFNCKFKYLILIQDCVNAPGLNVKGVDKMMVVENTVLIQYQGVLSLYKIVKKPLPQPLYLGDIEPPLNQTLCCFSCCSQGNLIAVCWSLGKVSFIPLIRN